MENSSQSNSGVTTSLLNELNDSLENEPNCSQVEEEPTLEIQVEDEPMDTQVDEQTQSNSETINPSISPTRETENTKTANPINVTLPQTLASGFALARIADFFAKEDERILRCHGFKPIFIPCERLELVFQRDRKDIKLRKMKEDREKRMAEYEEKGRRIKDNSKIGNDSDTDEREKKRRKKDKLNDNKRRHSPSNIYSGSVRSEAKPPQKRNFAPMVQCCVCELIVNKERFGGRDTLFCSEACISKKVEQARKCVKEGERILLMDHKGSMMNHAQNPTIETLEEFLLASPNYQPVLGSKLIEEANRLEHDPIYQKKVESMRVDVRKAIETALQKRSKAANMNFSLKRYKDLGVEIERALFSIHQDVNLRYRKWFKGFITVVNDENNLFFRDVLRDKVSVKKLVTLSVDQMYSSTSQIDPNCSTSTNIAPLKSASVVAAADSTSISDILEENINTELLASAISLRNKIASTTSRHSMLKKTPLSTAKAKSAIDDILGDMDKDTTHLHHSHLYDANCGVCKQNNLRKFAAKERLERLEAKLEQKRKAEEAKSGIVNFPNLDPSIQAAMLEDMSTETALNELDLLRQKHRDMAVRSADPYAITGDNNVLVGGNLGISDDPIDQERHLRDPLDLESVNALPSEQIDQNEEDTGSFDGGSGGNDDDNGFCDLNDGCFEPEAQQPQQKQIDFMEHDLGMDINSSQSDFHSHIEISKRNEITSQRPPPFEQNDSREVATDKNDSWIRMQKSSDIPKLFDHEVLDPRLTHLVWKGKFVWNSFISFDCTLAAISNKGAVKAGRELPASLSVMGRSEANGVWHYIGLLKDSWDKQVILLLVEHPKDLHQYDLCFDKVSSCDEQQIIVLDLRGHEQIKDGYVFTIGPGASLPTVLYPLDGPGLPEWCRTCGCMLLMLVRRIDREDRLWQKQNDENWRQRAHSSCNIENERFEHQQQLHSLTHNRLTTDIPPIWRKPGVTDESLSAAVKSTNFPPIWPPPEEPIISQPIETIQEYRGPTTPPNNSGFDNQMPSNNQEIIQQQNIETVQELLEVIRNSEIPESIVRLVSNFLEEHPDLTTYEKMNISVAVRQKIALEQNKNNVEKTNNNLNNSNEITPLTEANNVREEERDEDSLEDQQQQDQLTSTFPEDHSLEETEANNDLLRPYSPSDHIIDSVNETSSLSSTSFQIISEPTPVQPPPFPFPLPSSLETATINKTTQNTFIQHRQETTLSTDASNNKSKGHGQQEIRQPHSPPPPPPLSPTPSLMGSSSPPPPPPPPPPPQPSTATTTTLSDTVLQPPPPPTTTLITPLLPINTVFPSSTLLQPPPLISTTTSPDPITTCLLPPPPPPPTLNIRENEANSNAFENNVMDDVSFCDDIDLDNFDSMTKLHQHQHVKINKRPIINPSPMQTMAATSNDVSKSINRFRMPQPTKYLSSPVEIQNTIPARRPLLRPPSLPFTPPVQGFPPPGPAHSAATASNRIPLGNRFPSRLPLQPPTGSTQIFSSLPRAQPLNRFRQNAPPLFPTPSFAQQNSNNQMPFSLHSTVLQSLKIPQLHTSPPPLNKFLPIGGNSRPLKSVEFTSTLNEQSTSSHTSFTKNSAPKNSPIPTKKQQKNSSFITQKNIQNKGKKATTREEEEEEGEIDYFTEELEIPADFGLPTSFFSNKQRWEGN